MPDVFGMNLPVIEIALILLLLMIGCLIFILIQLKKLTNLIQIEIIDIERFEKDIGQFEIDHDLPSDELVHYIKQVMLKGMSKQDIEKVLLQKGWTHEQIRKVFKKVGDDLILKSL